MGLFDVFAGNVAADPHKEIVVDWRRGLTRAGLMEESGRVAAWLLAQGAGSESVVAVNLARGAAVASCLVGIWRAGACSMVVAADAPLATQRFFQDDARPGIVLDAAAFAQAMGCEPLEGWCHPEAHDAACIIYSSSSTGKAKGIVHEYGAFDDVAGYLGRFRSFGDFSYERIGCLGGDYDMSFLYTLVYTLCMGTTLCIAPMVKPGCDMGAVCRFVRRHRVTTTGAIAGSMDERALAQVLAQVPTMEYLQTGGDVSLRGGACPLPVLNCYGMSECFGMLTYGWVQQGEGVATAGYSTGVHGAGDGLPAAAGVATAGGGLPAAAGVATAGYSTGMFRVFLLDSAGSPVRELPSDGGQGCLLAAAEAPGGQGGACNGSEGLYPTDGIGEIAVENPYLRGYLNNPAETERAMRGGLFHTGDMGRIDARGRLTVLGRMADFALSPEGWVMPSYVHGALAGLMGGRAYAVRAFAGEGGAASPQPAGEGGAAIPWPAVCVFYEGEPLREEDCARILQQLPRELPAYMHPTHWIWVDALPRLARGKLNRAALEAIFRQELH